MLAIFKQIPERKKGKKAHRHINLLINSKRNKVGYELKLRKNIFSFMLKFSAKTFTHLILNNSKKYFLLFNQSNRLELAIPSSKINPLYRIFNTHVSGYLRGKTKTAPNLISNLLTWPRFFLHRTIFRMEMMDGMIIYSITYLIASVLFSSATEKVSDLAVVFQLPELYECEELHHHQLLLLLLEGLIPHRHELLTDLFFLLSNLYSRCQLIQEPLLSNILKSLLYKLPLWPRHVHGLLFELSADDAYGQLEIVDQPVQILILPYFWFFHSFLLFLRPFLYIE
ncbi:hypothetical protein BpHYR1_023035 [Brachionus plicatilis]|uniref:Uncharacterized protein n=1 Tax=Brachionus plicatilis TaxID=10195 RepID=A0A3M7QN22_BRAPC|nr:hypothetical protein BpHYR1_023035 [Brachionus plicatilis]